MTPANRSTVPASDAPTVPVAVPEKMDVTPAVVTVLPSWVQVPVMEV